MPELSQEEQKALADRIERLDLDRACGMQFPFGDYVSLMSKFCCRENAKMNPLAIDANLGNKIFSVPMYAKKTRFVSNLLMALILPILSIRNLAQIAYTIVRAISIDMIEIHRRPFSMNVQPNNSVIHMIFAEYPNSSIAIWPQEANWLAYPPTRLGTIYSSEYASFWFVVKKFFGNGLGKCTMGWYHDALRKLIDKESADVSRVSGLNYNNTGGVF